MLQQKASLKAKCTGQHRNFSSVKGFAWLVDGILKQILQICKAIIIRSKM